MGLPDRHRVFPCGEWIRNVIARVDTPLPADSFARKISEQAAVLEGLGKLSGRMDLAIDMHLMSQVGRQKDRRSYALQDEERHHLV